MDQSISTIFRKRFAKLKLFTALKGGTSLLQGFRVWGWHYPLNGLLVPSPYEMISKLGEHHMRVLRIFLIVMATLAQAHAEEGTDTKSGAVSSNCHYTISQEKIVEIPVGASACFQAPPPYTDIYGLLHCYPPLTEIDQVKRGDPRCGNRYNE
jgi:hypothetical protein